MRVEIPPGECAAYGGYPWDLDRFLLGLPVVD